MASSAEISTAVSSAPTPAPAGLSRALVTLFVDFCDAVTSVLSAGILLKGWRSGRKEIFFNGVVGYVSAIYLWVMFPYGNIAFLYFVPFFHSLQYLGFV
jgi:hypothetical protein